MSISGIYHGFLRKYGGFMFKQWKERYLVLTPDGNLLVCHDSTSPPDQLVALQGGCEAIVEGKEILDLPRLPSGMRKDSCFALILPQDKFLLLLADNPDDCSHWVNMLRKVKESVTSPLPRSCTRHQAPTLCITDRDPAPDPTSDTQDPTSPLSDKDSLSPGPIENEAQCNKDKCRKSPRSKRKPGATRSSGCLRHGNSSDARAVRAVYLFMGGAAASSAMGYLSAGVPSTHDARAAELPTSADLCDVGSGGAYHSCSQAADSPHFHSFDFEGDSDVFDFDCGGFAF